jgi:hypothetical protein
VSKLLERLKDPGRSGVYRVTRADEVLDAAQARIDLGQPAFDAFARALAFPGWFGRNWDALEDCLSDLSWLQADGHVLLLEGQPDPVLIEVLASAAQFWAGQGKPFFAVLVDPARRLSIKDLFRGA